MARPRRSLAPLRHQPARLRHRDREDERRRQYVMTTMDRPRKPRTIGDLLDDRRFEQLLMPTDVYRMHKAGRIAIEHGPKAARAWLAEQQAHDEESPAA